MWQLAVDSQPSCSSASTGDWPLHQFKRTPPRAPATVARWGAAAVAWPWRGSGRLARGALGFGTGLERAGPLEGMASSRVPDGVEWDVLWASLEREGWQLVAGGRPQDCFYLPPGITCDNMGQHRLRQDYFDSKVAVRRYVKGEVRAAVSPVRGRVLGELQPGAMVEAQWPHDALSGEPEPPEGWAWYSGTKVTAVHDGGTTFALAYSDGQFHAKVGSRISSGACHCPCACARRPLLSVHH